MPARDSGRPSFTEDGGRHRRLAAVVPGTARFHATPHRPAAPRLHPAAPVAAARRDTYGFDLIPGPRLRGSVMAIAERGC
ncbi:hypothetical protein GCM10022420_070560 [Streptomyces iranensis]